MFLMKKHTSNDYIKIPKSFTITSEGVIKYDFKAMRDYFNSILKTMGEQ